MKLIYFLLTNLLIGLGYGLTIKDCSFGDCIYTSSGLVFFTVMLVLVLFLINLWYYTNKHWVNINCPLCNSKNIRLTDFFKRDKNTIARVYCADCERAMTVTGFLVSTIEKVKK